MAVTSQVLFQPELFNVSNAGIRGFFIFGPDVCQFCLFGLVLVLVLVLGCLFLFCFVVGF